MVIRASRFNFNLLLLAGVLGLVPGCQTSPEKKVTAVLRIHLEVNPDVAGLKNSAPVPIYRSEPMMVNVENTAFLTEAYITKAAVLETTGSFALQIQYDLMGARILEQYSATNPHKRLAIFCQFGEKKPETRWLAAPLIAKRISNGMLVFTPDCTREEANQIALGLNNLVTKREKLNLIKQ